MNYHITNIGNAECTIMQVIPRNQRYWWSWASPKYLIVGERMLCYRSKGRRTLRLMLKTDNEKLSGKVRSRDQGQMDSHSYIGNLAEQNT